MKKSLLLTFHIFTFFAQAQVWRQSIPDHFFPTSATNIIETGQDTVWVCGYGNVLARTVNGGQSWESRQNPPGGTYWSRSQFFNAREAYFLGANSVAKTTDGTATWTISSVGSSLSSIYFINKDTGWVGGSNALIYKTTNSGVTWTPQANPAPTNTNITDIYFITRDTGFATAYNGSNTTLLRTLNGGSTWNIINYLPSGFARFSFLNKDTGFVASGSQVYATYNKGMNWQLKVNRPAYQVLFTSRDTGFYTYGNYVMKTFNGGTNWDTLYVFRNSTSSAVLSNGAGRAYCTNGTDVIRSVDNNNGVWDTILIQMTPAPSSFTSGFMPDAKTGWVVGSNGLIWKTQDSSATWSIQNSNTKKNLYKVFALNKDTAWAAGNGIMLRSYNGGNTWDSIWSQSFNSVPGFVFINKDTGFILHPSSGIYRTINAGNTWGIVTHNGSTSSFNDIHFLNKDTGFICGASGHLLRTVNGGATWVKITINTTTELDNISFFGDYGIVTAVNLSLYTLDRGNTWISKTAIAGSSFYDVKMVSPDAILAYTYNDLVKSSDRGASWQNIPINPVSGFYYPTFLFADSSFIVGVSTERIVNGKGNWTLIPSLDSLSIDSFVNTDSIAFIAYGKNFDATSIPVSLTNTTLTYNLLSSQQMQVSYKRTTSTKFPINYYNFYISNTGETAGRTATIRLTVYDTLPLIPASGINLVLRDSSKFTLSCTKGSGTLRMLVLRKGAPINRFPSNDSATFTANLAFGSGTHLGEGNYVMSTTSAISYSITALEPNTTYYYAIIEYTRTSVPRNFNTHVFASGSFKTSNVYYNKTSGALNKVSSWSTRPDGTGNAPLDFADSCTYYLANYNSSPVIDSSWNVTGYKSYVVMGNGTTSFNYYIFPGSTVNIDSLRTKTNVTITNDGNLLFRKATFETGTLVQFISTTAQNIAPGTYHEITVNGSEKLLLGTVDINGTFNMIGNINCNGYFLRLNNYSNPTALNYLDGMIKGKFYCYVHASTNPNLFPLGIGNNYHPVYITLPGTGQGAFVISVVDTFINNAGLPLFDATLSPLVKVSKASRECLWRVEQSSGTYTLGVTATGFAGIADSSKLRLIKRNIGGTWVLQGTALPVSGSANAPLVSRSGLTGAGEFTIGSDSTINTLPVKLISFNGIKTNGVNHLKWITASEINNAGFYIYRSIDNRTWEEVGFVKGTGSASSYQFNDAAITYNTYYYFLSQVDYNGASNYSQVISIDASDANTNKIVVWPNPVSGETLSINGNFNFPAQVYIHNAAGIKVKSVKLSNQQELEAISVEGLESGLYFLQVTDALKTINTRFIRK